jgi:hypothetical protein
MGSVLGIWEDTANNPSVEKKSSWDLVELWVCRSSALSALPSCWIARQLREVFRVHSSGFEEDKEQKKAHKWRMSPQVTKHSLF